VRLIAINFFNGTAALVTMLFIHSLITNMAPAPPKKARLKVLPAQPWSMAT